MKKTIYKIRETKYTFPAGDRPILDENDFINACYREDDFIKSSVSIIKDYCQDLHPVFGYELIFTDYDEAENYIRKNFTQYEHNCTDIDYDCLNDEFYYYEYKIIDFSKYLREVIKIEK